MKVTTLAGNFFIGLSDPELTQDERLWFSKFGAAGVVFFSRNIQEPTQLQNLMREIRSQCLQSPLGEPPLFCIDMEGGRISELKAPHFKTWPVPIEYLEQNPEASLYSFGLEMGRYLKGLGFNINFTPCLDTLTNPENHLIKGRALGESAEVVCQRGKDMIHGFMDSQIMTAAKHFPGHGHTLADSHFELPVDDRSLEELKSRSLPPFQMAVEMKVPFFMTAHVIYSQVDPEWPATLSEIWMKEIFRQQMMATQFCLADDLDMKALVNFGNSNEIAARFFNSGGDFIMYCHRKTPPFEILDYLQDQILPSERVRIEIAQKTLSRIKLAFV